MEFKDRLKEQRKQRKLSQQKLADEIFVSRSAVAKWENGLGIPNEASYTALLTFFELTPEQFPLNEENEVVCVTKNKTIRRLSVCVIALSVMMVATLAILFINASNHGFGLTSRAAAGEQWRDCELYHTEEYDFYVDYFGDIDEWGGLMNFCAVRNQAVGYQRIDIGAHRLALYREDAFVGYIYAFATEQGFLYVIPATTTVFKGEGNKINILYTSFPYITVNGEEITGEHRAFFELSSEMSEFYYKDERYEIRPAKGDEIFYQGAVTVAPQIDLQDGVSITP